MFFLVEEMKRLIAQQRDFRMLREKIVDRGGAGLLHTRDDEIYAFDFATPEKIRLHFQTVTTFGPVRN